MAYDKKPAADYWIRPETGPAVHIGHVGQNPYILFSGDGADAKFTVGQALTIALQLTRHAIIAKIRKR